MNEWQNSIYARQVGDEKSDSQLQFLFRGMNRAICMRPHPLSLISPKT